MFLRPETKEKIFIDPKIAPFDAEFNSLSKYITFITVGHKNFSGTQSLYPEPRLYWTKICYISL